MLLVATTDSGKLVVVSSAYVQHSPQLRMDLSYYDAFVAGPTARATHAAVRGTL